MIELDLETQSDAEKQVKEYLENNVSETLAEKINNGVQIVKDNKTLINKKTLSGFMKYASNEAKKLAENGANCTCIEDATVFGWAIHYFEEETIEEKLYNEDGSEYKIEVKTTKPTPKVETPKKKQSKQSTLFDLMNFDNNGPTKEELEQPPIEYDEVEDNDIDDFSEQEIDEALDEVDKELLKENNQVVDTTTGEVINSNSDRTSSIDKELAIMLYTLLDGNLEVK